MWLFWHMCFFKCLFHLLWEKSGKEASIDDLGVQGSDQGHII